MTAAGRYRAYPAYKPSGVEWLGDIPEGWELWKIAHAFDEIGSGTTPPSDNPKWYEGGIPWVTTGELREGTVFETSKSVSPRAVAAYPTLRLHPAGSIVIAMYGATIGRLGILGVAATTNQACCVIPKSDDIESQYLYYWLQAFKAEIISLSVGGGQPNINQEIVRSLRVSCPPLPEQTQIAAFLDYETAKIDALIAKQQRLIELLEEKRQAVISHAVTKGLNPSAPLRPSGIDWLGDVPAHWEVKRVKQVARLNPSKSELQHLSGQTKVTFLPMEAVGDRGELNTTAERELCEVRSGYTYVRDNDVCIAKITPCFENGKGAVMTGLTNSIAFATTELIPMRCTNDILPQFLYFLLVSTPFNKVAEGSMYGAGGQKRVADSFVANYHFSLPSPDEQTAIVDFVIHQIAHFDRLNSKAQSAITLLKERRTALISAAVTGKIDVRDWQPPQPIPDTDSSTDSLQEAAI